MYSCARMNVAFNVSPVTRGIGNPSELGDAIRKFRISRVLHTVHVSTYSFHVTQNTVTSPRPSVIASRRHPALCLLPSACPRVPPFFLVFYAVSFLPTFPWYVTPFQLLSTTSKLLRADLYDRFLLSSSTPRPLFTMPLWRWNFTWGQGHGVVCQMYRAGCWANFMLTMHAPRARLKAVLSLYTTHNCCIDYLAFVSWSNVTINYRILDT